MPSESCETMGNVPVTSRHPEPCFFPPFDKGEQDFPGSLSIEGQLVDPNIFQCQPIPDVLCSSWALVLSCFTGQETVCFGFSNNTSRTTRDTNHSPHTRQLAQLYVNGSQKLQEVITAYDLHTLPQTDTTTLFNTAVTLGDRTSDASDTAPCNGDVHFPPCKIHITVDLATLQSTLSWDGTFMTREQAHNVKSTYAAIVTHMIKSPDHAISKLNYFSERNLRQVQAWNNAPLSNVRDCIHQVIARQGASHPQAEAVCSWDGTLTYTELLSLSSRLASWLVKCGTTTETMVPICFNKSKWTVVAMLAVLKAGGIFVPLDPTHPVPRLQALVQKVGASLLLCSPNHVDMLETVAHTLIPVDSQLFIELPEHDGKVDDVSHSNGAYMIFTSGTTGEPKGALIEHGALLSSALAHGPAMMMDCNTRSLQFAASTFDVSITEILTCLILGGCVCVPSEEARLNAIEDAITELRVNWALLTPTFVKFIDPQRVPSLKTLVTGGEAMTQAIIRSWSHINLINCYGPAETSVVSHVHRGMTEAKNPLNIGEQVGIHCWVVDRYNHDRLMPVGAVGELVIESHTLAREYYKEPERTAEAFIVDPLWVKDQPRAAAPRRMYKTGDLVKYNADGTFHIAGRKDTQIKYHGQRIELGEIEHHLNDSPSIKHAMVVLPKEGLCKGRLLTVIQLSTALNEDLVPKGRPYKLIEGELETTAKTSVEEVKDMLSKRLPPYMVPSMWIAVEFIPRLQSGKLDRKQTAQWVNNMSEQLYRQLNPVVATEATDDLAFANPTEKSLHEIWSHVLDLKPEQLGLGQSFLSVGGDSISAMQVMAESKKRGLGLTVRHIIGTKSISDLALHVKDIEQPLFHKEVLEQPFDLSPIQKLYFSRPKYELGHYNQSFLLRTSRRILPSELHTAIKSVINRHSMLRARFMQSSEGQWQQRITSEVQSSYRLRALQLSSSDEIDGSIVDSQTCLSATDGPLFAADLIDVDGKEQLLFAVAHHLVIDLVSWRVILQEIEEALLRPDSLLKEESPLPFQIWCKMQSEHARSLTPAQVLPIANVPDGGLGYWGMDGVPNVYGQMIQEGFEMDTSLTALLMSECNDSLRTEIPDILLAAMISSFKQVFTDRRVPAIFAEGHGREVWDPTIDLSTVVGWFTTIYPVFSDISPNFTLVEVVKLIKDARRKVPASGRPYFASRWLTQEGSEAFSRHWPLEITFNYLGKYQQLEREGALFTPVGDIAGEVRSATQGADIGPETACISLFEVSAVVLKGSLRFSFLFNKNIKHKDAVHEWIDLCRQHLSTMIQELSGRVCEPSLSDFPLLDLSYDGLDVLVHEKLPAAGVTSFDMVEDIYPCSPMQSGLLVSTAKDEDFYAAYALHEVKSQSNKVIDADRLASAWVNLVQYHSILRTVFVESASQQDSLFDQVVLKHVENAVVRSEVTSEDKARKLLDVPTPHARGSKQPLYRFEICTSNDGKVFCKLDISHTIMDGTSMSIIFRDLARAYEGTLNMGLAPLYGNYIAYITQQATGPGLEYWSKYLSGIEPCHFPVLDDGETHESKELKYVRVHFEELAALQSLCDSRGVTIVNAIYAAWALTLRLYTASEEVCFGYLTSSRDLPIDGVRDVVGPVINMVVCRLQVLGASTLGELMSTVQQDYLNSLAFRHVPLAEVQHALHLSSTALFNTALSYRKLPRPEECPPDILFEECRPTYDPDEYNVSINIEAGEEGMAIDLMYWTDTLSDGQANNVASSFTQALKNILHSCDSSIAQLNHLGEWNQKQLCEWNPTIPNAIESCVHDLIVEQAIRRPDAPAIASWDLNINYEELDQLSTAFARYIALLGVSLEVPVLICFEKSGLAIVTMLAILRAGGICVPLDPGHPDTALKLRADDTGASLAFVSPSQAERFESLSVRATAVDCNLVNSSTGADDVSLPVVQPNNACFIIYTSGSTGRPKGVVLEHRGIATNAIYTAPLLGYHQDSRVLQFASYTFDNSLAEIFTTLVAGGCVCVPSEHERLNDLAGVINRLRVTLADITPTVACFLQPAEVPTLKTLALGGEAVTSKCVNMWKDFVSLQCCYGPSECSVNSTYSGAIAQPGQATNIGRAVGCVCWVVDQNDVNCLVPIGCVGELLVDGSIVSRGYLNLPERTKQSFIDPPRWSEDVLRNSSSDRRLYKTGDLVQYNSDGTLMYLGRKDTQVKLNGQRIELGEIERNIEKQLPEGSQIAVELVAAGTKKALACFICTELDSAVPDSSWQSDIVPISEDFRSQAKSLEIALASQMPAYMVPSIWLPITKMPLSSAGKLNRRSLRLQAESVPPALLSDYMLASKSGRAPSSDVENLIAGFWASILDVEVAGIGVEDNFFKLGGDSLGAMRLVTLARNSHLTLTVASIFQEPTLFDMAKSAKLTSANAEPVSSTASLVKDAGSMDALKQELAATARVEVQAIEDVYPCTAIQEGLMALSNREPGAYVAQFVYRLSPGVDLAKFMKAWEAVVKTEPVLRTRIVHTEEHGFLQVPVDEEIFWSSVSNLDGLQKSDRLLPQHNGAALTHYALVGAETEAPSFVWTIHHALYDGWCLPIILAKVKECYMAESLANMEPLNGPPYAKFVRYISSLDVTESEKFWTSNLSNVSTRPFPRLPSPSYQANASSLVIHKTPLSRQTGSAITLATRIRTAWALTNAMYSDNDDVVFWETVTGRDAPVSGIEDMVGATLATVPVRVTLASSCSVHELLTRVQNHSAAMMSHQYLGIQKIKHLGDGAASACDAQNLIAINHGPRDPVDSFWDEESNEMAGTNFYTYPLMLSFHIGEKDLEAVVHFDCDVIAEWQTKRVMDHFSAVLDTLGSPQMLATSLGELNTLSPTDVESLQLWNQSMPPLIDNLVHDLIKTKGESEEPDKMAVCSWDGDLTHSALDTLSSRLAGALSERGIVAGMFVPFCLEKSYLAVVSMLAIMKCGAAFVPLDPSHPDTRMSMILEDVEATLVLCSPSQSGRFDRLGVSQMPLTKTIVEDFSEPQTLTTMSPDEPAYVIFTSGTTGKPKGTIVSHKAFCSGAAAHGSAMGMNSHSRVLQFASYTFDASIMEVLTTLVHGGTVCIPSDEERLNDIAGAISRLDVNWALLTPSVAQLIAPSMVPSLKTLVLGGEAMSAALLATWSASSVQLMNAYGPSETSVVATVNSNVTLNSGPTNIGRSVGSLCWVVDASNHDKLVPIGATGELVVEGPILANGYLKNPEKTAEAFIDSPKWSQKISSSATSTRRKMYKTGDLVKLADDGSIIFQGRKDDQVKINGQRLELSEVEHNLTMDPEVQHGLVTVPASGPLKQQLTAIVSLKSLADLHSETGTDSIHVTSKQTGSLCLTAIRERVASRLAAYMVPSRWVVIDKFPLQPSGKLDRRKVLGWAADMSEELYQEILSIEENTASLNREPSDVEEQLRSAWAKVLNLKVDKVPYNQSFLHLGGDSISAMKLMAVCRASNLALNVSQIMQSRSIVDLAQHATLVHDVVYDTECEDEPFELSPIQKVYFDCMGTSSTHFNQSILLATTRKVTLQELSVALERIVESHGMLRARFSQTNGVWSQRVTKDARESFQLRSHLHVGSNEISTLIHESQTCLDIGNGPLVAADLFDTSDNGDQMILIVAHHLVVDVVSWQIILHDLEQLLRFPDTTRLTRSLPFQIWTRAQAVKARQETFEQVFHDIALPEVNLAYWGMEGQYNLHGDSVLETLTLDALQSNVLLGPCHEALGTDVPDVLLAALLASFRRSFPDRPFAPAIFNEGHGRETWDNAMDLSRTVGWFTTLCPIFLPDLGPGDTDALDVVQWVKDFRRKTPGNGRPYFAHSVQNEQARGEFSKWPLEIAFNYLGKTQGGDAEDSIFKSLDGGFLDAINSQSDLGDEVPRLALIDITASVASGALEFSFSINRHMDKQDLIQKWVSNLRLSLVEVVERLCATSPQRTLSDFPTLPLSYGGMTEFKNRLSQAGNLSMDNIEDAYPCSAVQQGIILTQIKTPDRYAYSITFEVHSKSSGDAVDIQRLSVAWEAVVRRHSTLRTVFLGGLNQEDSLDQVVLSSICPNIAIVETTDDKLHEIISAQTSLGIPENQPPHRLRIFQTPNQSVVCVLEMSHAIADGSSMPILFRDLSLAYDGVLPSTHVSAYRDFIAHTRGTSDTEATAFWKNYLQGVEPCHFPALANADSKPILRALDQPLSSVKELNVFCIASGVTLSNLLQLIWALVLQAYTGLDDVCFGYLASNRDVPVNHIDEAIGVFINMLVFRIHLDPSVSILDTLNRVKKDLLQSMQHKGPSLAQIQHEVSASSTPLFNTAYSFQRRSVAKSMSTGSLSFDVREAQDPSEYDITVNIEVWDSCAELQLCYWTDKVSDDMARNVASTFDQILTSIVSVKSAAPIGSLPLVSEHCMQQLARWNKEEPEYTERCVHHIFEENALQLSQDTQAIDAWDSSFTYQQLNEDSTRLAQHLVSLGIGTNTYVPLCFEKSAWTVVAMIAVLKAGGAFVPLDPAHPPERTRFLVRSVQAKVALCSPSLEAKLSIEGVDPVVISEETVSNLPGVQPNMAPTCITPEDAAYIIFTSGTTGLPKGTIVGHGAFSTGGLAHAKAIKMGPTSRVLQFASHTFDASIMEILTTLLVGGCICIPSNEERLNDLSGAIDRLNVNWTLLTPSVANVLKPGSVPSLKVLVTGGEAMSSDHITKWGNHCALVNAYGPSETSVIATTSTKVDESGTILDTQSSTIGRAVGSRAWVVDPRDHNRLMPIGSVGELVVEGPIVAKGYLDNETKTREAFIDHPSWRQTLHLLGGRRDRMYKTGDLAAYNTDGSLRYMARKDTQIKLNGQRIELGEIEHHVKENLPTDVQSAVELVVTKTKAALETKSLVVFLTSNVDIETSADEILLPMSDQLSKVCTKLKSDLANTLPSYMVPGIFVPVIRMPWTSAGKLDRNGLRTIVQSLPPQAMSAYKLAGAIRQMKPMTPIQKKLHNAWRKVLGHESVTITSDDSFFRLGGDSLGAMKLVSAAKMENVVLSVMDIFKYPKLSDMAARSRESGQASLTNIPNFSLLERSDSSSGLPEEFALRCGVPKSDIQDAYPCSSLQEGLVTSSLQTPGAYVARNVFELPEDVDLKQFKLAWQRTVDQVDILRSRIVNSSSSKSYQVVFRHHAIDWNLRSSLQSTESDSKFVPGNNGGALALYSIVEQGGSLYFVWTVHHALYDAWSLPSILRIASDYYSGNVNAGDSWQTPYVNFINYLEESDTVQSDKFWRAELDDASASHFPPVSSLSANDHGSSATLNHVINYDPATLGGDTTIASIIRAAWSLVLGSQTGSDHVVFGETLSGRDIALRGINEIIGPTLTTVPQCVRIDRDDTVGHFIAKIHNHYIEMIPHQHAGLQRIRRLGESTAVACDFQNLLVIQAAEDMSDDTELMKFVDDSLEAENFFTYPLVVECALEQQSLKLSIHHNTKILSSWQVKRIAHHFDALIQQLCSTELRSTQKVAELRHSSPEDVQLLREWNEEPAQLVEESIPSLFRHVASKQSDASAIHAWDGELTYGQLLHHAEGLANILKQQGVQVETFVPCCLDKSLWATVSMLAVILAGGALVPLDPMHPPARHAEIVRDCDATIVLCSRQHQDRFEELAVDTMVIDSDLFLNKLGQNGIHSSPLPNVKSHNAAFVIYTSGSTGKPKGVIIEHKSFCASSKAYMSLMHLTPTSRVFHFTSYAFDIAMGEIFGSFTLGACVCVPSEEMRTGDLAGAVTFARADWAFLTPSVANIQEPALFKTLKTLVCGGEALTPETIEKWADKVELMNGYGPAECTIFCVANAEVSIDKDHTRIGRSMTGGRSWVVDPRNHDYLVPLGCVGELLIDGPIVSRGYLHEDAKTKEVFIEDPAWAKSFTSESMRLYKTGDLVKYRPDGSLSFVGRKDHQVKLHGQRLELGEIEAKLELDKRIRHSHVSLPKSGICKGRIVAVVSLDFFKAEQSSMSKLELTTLTPLQVHAARPEIVSIQNRLQEVLPPYMVPSTWLVVGSLPFLVSGKLDRASVQSWLASMNNNVFRCALSEDSGDETTREILPREKVLRRVMSSVLNLSEEVTPLNQSFISMGGDSITAMQVMTRCRDEGFNLTLQEIIRSKAIRALAEAMTETKKTKESFEPEQPLNQYFALSPIQQLFFDNSCDKSKGDRFNQSQVLRISSHIQPEYFQHAVHALVDHHSMLRARFGKDSGGRWRQLISSDISGSYKSRTHKIANEAELGPLIAAGHNEISVNGPLFVTDLFEQEDGSQILSLVAHHLVVDIVSWVTIIQHLESLLETPSTSLAKSLSFQAWNKAQVEHFKTLAAKDNNSRLFEAQPADPSFWGMSETPNVYGDMIQQSFVASEEVTLALAQGSGFSALRTEPLDLFISSLLQSFALVFEERALPTLFNESHGRYSWDDTIDVTQTVGWFTALSPVQISLSDPGDSIEAARKVKDTRRTLSKHGVQCFGQHYLRQSEQQENIAQGPMEVLLNFLGRTQQHNKSSSLLQPLEPGKAADQANTVSDVASETHRLALFEISISLCDEGIQFTFMYNKHMEHQDRIDRWVSKCHAVLIQTAQALNNSQLTPTLSDFPLMPMNDLQLLNLLDKSLPAAQIDSYEQVEDIYPCSPIQTGMLLGQVQDPSRYIFHTVVEVCAQDGNTDVRKLSQACGHVIDRHASLRTVFVNSVYSGGAFDQVVLKPSSHRIRILSCKEIEVMAKLNPVSLQKTNKGRGPSLPYQITICSTPQQRVFMKLEMNHAVTDGASTSLILQEIGKAYTDNLILSEAPSYKEYIDYITNKPLDTGLTFWVTYLAGATPTLFTPLSPFSHERSLQSIIVDFERWHSLHELAVQSGVTLSSIVLASWALLLRRYTNSEDVCFGLLASGRDAPIEKVDEIVGPLINMLIMRFQFSAGMLLKTLFHEAQGDYLSSLAHQHVPLANVAHALGHKNRQFFNTAVSIQSSGPSENAAVEPLLFNSVEAHDPSEFSVTLNVNTARNDEGILIRYWSDILTEEGADELAAKMTGLLNDFIDHADEALSHLRLFQGWQLPISIPATPETVQSWSSQDRERSRRGITSSVPTSESSFDPDSMTSSRSKKIANPAQLENALSTKLRSLWSETLGLETSSITNDTSFFELGGDSIVAMSMASSARELGLPLNVAGIFKNPTFGEMLACLWEDSVPEYEPSSHSGDEIDFPKKESFIATEASYQPFSMVGSDDLESFIKEVVCPVTGVSRATILDVLPATDFQAQSVQGHLLDSRWMLNHFYLEGEGSLDVELLRESITNVVAAFDILRTVFVQHQQATWQVVLRQVPIMMNVQAVEDLNEFTTSLIEDHKKHVPQLGRPLTQFTVARHSSSNRHRIFIRISHSQYDGLCFPAILEALKASYEGRPISTTPPFRTFMSGSTSQEVTNQHEYWTKLLAGSEMTNVIARNRASLDVLPTKVLKRTVDMQSLASLNITTATVVKAAWSIALAKMTDCHDVVFGHLVNGRNISNIAQIESIVGPCLNVVPVRVQINKSNTALELLEQVQSQQVDSMPHESLGFRQIIEKCTDWRDHSGLRGFSTTVQHQSMAQTQQLKLGGTEYGVGALAPDVDTADFSVVTTPAGENAVEVCLIYAGDGLISEDTSMSMFDFLCRKMQDISGNPRGVLGFD